jgi:hypothetical protein
MMAFKKILTAALFLSAAAFAPGAPANAAVAFGFSFHSGDVGFVFGSPCYGSRVCGYPVYSAPVFIEGEWYQGFVYYRWDHGVRLFWYHGAWRRDEWRGPRPTRIEWRDWREHGAWRDDWRDDRDWHERHDNKERRGRFENERSERERGRDRDRGRDR